MFGFSLASDFLLIERDLNGTNIDTFAELPRFVFATPLGSGARIGLGGNDAIYLYGVTSDEIGPADVSFF